MPDKPRQLVAGHWEYRGARIINHPRVYPRGWWIAEPTDVAMDAAVECGNLFRTLKAACAFLDRRGDA